VIKMNKEDILARVKEHYDYLIAANYDVVFTALQGSQNYELDEYTSEYWSDIDTKSIILPCLDDFIMARAPVSAVKILDNEEHAEIKDIRIMFEMFKKENISYIELLYSDYIIFNPKYEKMIKPIFQHRDQIVAAHPAQFLKCIAGMAYEKNKALCHPYPGIIDKIEKYGYDGKQLSHCARLLLFISSLSNGETVVEAYKPAAAYKQILMNYKKQLDENGNPLSAQEAKIRCEDYMTRVKEIKDNLINKYNFTENTKMWIFLDEIKATILKFKITEEVLNGNNLDIM